MSSVLEPVAEQVTASVVAEACNRIAPLWPLHSFVAVNPFLGLSDMPFAEAAQLMQRVVPGGILPNQEKNQSALIPTVASDRWVDFITDEISKWCSAYYDRGQCVWKMPWADLSLWHAWKKAAEIDANPEVFGLHNFRKFVRSLPDSAEEALDHLLSLLSEPRLERSGSSTDARGLSEPRLERSGSSTDARQQSVDFLHRELMSISGWASYTAYKDRNSLPHLLAIRLAYDAALLQFNRRAELIPRGSSDPLQKLEASEKAYREELLQKLRSAPISSPTRKSLQAIFCIDVRSEIYRRALESQSPEIETIGFAGFFGMPIAVSESARCPVLLNAKYELNQSESPSNFAGISKVWKALTQSAIGCFPAVELGGTWFGVKMLQQWFKKSVPQTSPNLSWNIPLSERIDLAAGALKNMSVDVTQLAPVVLFCGHGSQTENNPYEASLDCGACGGHKGDVNARFAASLLNDKDVRAGLRERGINIPHDTTFIAGLHITTTDEVRLLDVQGLPQIEAWLKNASQVARRERNPNSTDEEVFRRSVDWSEVRPEWGLAGNAAFIAAPRSRTRNVNLEGRVFLHDYNPDLDEDGSVLTLILTAPVIVASWINLQYYASTVNNQVFGSGNKTLHNVVGGFGIWEGNGGDLRTGLPLQSLHDGTKWRHEPLRLLVLIDAPRERIQRVLQANRDIRNLVENGWLHLLAWEGDQVTGVIYPCE